MIKKELITVVIPVYNVEKYLRKCLESVKNQTYNCIEILLIDDGSTDKSGKICDEYSKNDKRFKVFHMKNAGVSNARNVGIQNANGKYICFIDSDDYVNYDYICDLYSNLIKYNCDISMCFRKIFYEDKSDFKPNLISDIRIFEKNQIFLLEKLKSSHAFIMKLFKIELFNNLKFPNIKKGEDSYLMFDILLQNPKIVFDFKENYYYLERKSGATKTINIHQLDYITAMKHWTDKSKEIYGIESKEYYFCCIHLLNCIVKNILKIYKILNRKIIKEYYNLFNEYYYTISVKEKKRKIQYVLFKCLNLFLILISKGE